MRIVKCHIDGFGKLNKADYDFSEGITCIQENNGEGKSTLAAFIRAMLYGMKTAHAKGKEMSDREKYFPISGAGFGGSLAIKTDDGEYIIERKFDRKSASKDTLSVYDGNGHILNVEAVGEEIFKLNAESFERTAFFSLGDTSTEVGGDIGEKLGPLKIGRVSAEDAIKCLEDEMKQYRHKGRRGGAIYDNERQKNEYCLRLRELDEAKSNLAICDGKIEEKSKELSELLDEQKRLNEAALVAEKQKNYNDLVLKLQKERVARDELSGKYPKGIPLKEKCDEIAELNKEIDELASELKSAPLDERSAQRLSSLSERFAQAAPTDSELLDIESLAERHGGYQGKLLPTEKSSELLRLEKHFAANEPSAELTERVRLAAEGATPSVTRSKVAPYAAAAGLLAAMISVGVALVGVSLYAAIAVIVLGVIGEMATGFIYLLKRTAQAAILPNEELLKLIGPYGYRAEQAALFLSDAERYRALIFEYNEKESKRAEDKKNADECAERLDAAFERYCIEYKNYSEGAYSLRSAVNDYRQLLDDKRRADESCERLESRLAEKKAALSKILSDFSLSDADGINELLVRLNTDRAQLLRHENEISALTERAEREKPRDDISKPPPELDADTLAEKINSLNGEINSLKVRKGALENAVAKRVELEESIARLDEEIERMRSEYRIAELTRGVIEGVDRQMKERYSRPMNERFKHYAKLLEDKLTGARLDERLSLTYDEGGTLHRFDQLSSGERALVSLCMRLSLIDNIYKGERPFLLLDDPFAELDAEHFKKAARLLSDVSKDTQIIYFTCHESRIIEHK